MNGEFWSSFGWPYLLSNGLMLGLVFYAWKQPLAARYGYAFMFLAAALANATVVVVHPKAYLDYAFFAWGPYSDFIRGAFVGIVQVFVLGIALGQLILAFGFLGHGLVLKMACLGSAFFFACITPLGLGAAFPFPLLAMLGSYFVFRGASALKTVGAHP